ncbi:hypothetical protein L1987_00877 [Smallanthus sonchifolius]|uniref:Uncharacterized protein n=1 Tax=Smallanthus sonchifolius TaxID=185202 RepID=A0ACB9K3H0_9ASTR|nr:hypothetical protein L1987_00877 [Smallanthus sonchifolius]
MAASYFLKSNKFIMHNLKSSKFLINHTSSVTNSLFSRHLLHPPLPDHAGIKPFVGGRRSHTATSFSNDVDQVEKLKFTPKRIFTSGSNEERTNCYRVLNENGELIVDSDSLKISKELGVKMYKDMVTLQVMDTIFYEAQRQGRVSFYLTTIGEEAINIASAAALDNNDFVFPQYREPGVLLWRGFTLQEFANQLFGNKYDYGKGRQMPIHYGSKKHNYAVGAAYSMKMQKQDSCTITYFGDGGSSTGDFHAGLNFSAVMEVPVIFFCRNNGWAISTPISDQFRSDGIVVRGKAYGVPSIRVDGNDALAIYSAVYEARKMAIEKQTPVLIEALTYRAGHHSTSDDSTKYRPVDEIEWWRDDQNPVKRFRTWIENKGWWSDQAESEHRSSVRKQLSQAIQAAERVEKPPVADMFNDVYDVLPKNLNEQEVFLRENIKKHAQEYPSNVPM